MKARRTKQRREPTPTPEPIPAELVAIQQRIKRARGLIRGRERNAVLLAVYRRQA